MCWISFLFFSFAASHQTCVPEKSGVNPWVSVRELLPGCWSSFVMVDGAEVHILSLMFDPTVSMPGPWKCVCVCVFNTS